MIIGTSHTLFAMSFLSLPHLFAFFLSYSFTLKHTAFTLPYFTILPKYSPRKFVISVPDCLPHRQGLIYFFFVGAHTPFDSFFYLIPSFLMKEKFFTIIFNKQEVRQ